jgi:hypothetical protein
VILIPYMRFQRPTLYKHLRLRICGEVFLGNPGTQSIDEPLDEPSGSPHRLSLEEVYYHVCILQETSKIKVHHPPSSMATEPLIKFFSSKAFAVVGTLITKALLLTLRCKSRPTKVWKHHFEMVSKAQPPRSSDQPVISHNRIPPRH